MVLSSPGRQRQKNKQNVKNILGKQRPGVKHPSKLSQLPSPLFLFFSHRLYGVSVFQGVFLNILLLIQNVKSIIDRVYWRKIRHTPIQSDKKQRNKGEKKRNAQTGKKPAGILSLYRFINRANQEQQRKLSSCNKDGRQHIKPHKPFNLRRAAHVALNYGPIKQ